MIDQLTLQTIGILLTGISLSIAAIYYTITIRNQNRTSQAQLLMGLYESYRSTESRMQSLEIQSWEYKDMDDFFQKYGDSTNPEAWAIFESKAAFFNGVGILLKRDLIDIKLLDDLLTSTVNRHWNRLGMGPILVEWRERLRVYREERGWRRDPGYSLQVDESAMNMAFYGFDFLYNSLMKYRETHPPIQKT